MSVACCVSFILFCCVPSLRDHVVGVGDFIVCAESTAIICVDDFIDFMSNTREKKIHCFGIWPLIMLNEIIVSFISLNYSLFHVVLLKTRFYCGRLISYFFIH